MAIVKVDRCLFGLRLSPPTGSEVARVLHSLPRQYVLPPVARGGEWIVALTPELLPIFRRLFTMENVEFSPDAIDALASLSGRKSAPQARQRVEIAPEVSAALRRLPATLDPTEPAQNGDSIPQTTGASLSEERKS